MKNVKFVHSSNLEGLQCFVEIRFLQVLLDESNNARKKTNCNEAKTIIFYI